MHAFSQAFCAVEIMREPMEKPTLHKWSTLMNNRGYSWVESMYKLHTVVVIVEQ